MPLPLMAMVVPDSWRFEFLECSIKNGNSTAATCLNKTAQCEECSVSELYSQPSLAGAEAGHSTRCLPGITNESAKVHIQGKFGDGDYRYAQVNCSCLLVVH